MAQPSSKQPVEPLSMAPQKGPPTSSSCSVCADDGSSLMSVLADWLLIRLILQGGLYG